MGLIHPPKSFFFHYEFLSITPKKIVPPPTNRKQNRYDPARVPGSPSQIPTPAPSEPVYSVACSLKTCTELDLLGSIAYGSLGVCGGSSGFNENVACSSTLSWLDARDFCEGAGARLCSYDELSVDEARGTGCGHDNKMIWSRTACDGGGFLVQMGASKRGDTRRLCADRATSGTYYARCCADEYSCSPTSAPTSPSAVPTPLPTVIPTPFPTRKPSTPPSPVPTVLPSAAPSSTDTVSVADDSFLLFFQ